MSKTLPALNPASDADGTEEFLVNQLGNPRRMTGIQLRAYLSATLFPTTELLETFEIPAEMDTIFVSGTPYIRVDGDPNIARGIRSLDRFLPDGSTDNANGGWWRPFNTASLNILEFIPRTEWSAIRDRTSTYEVDVAFADAIGEFPADSRDGAGQIIFPPGQYEFGDTINLQKPVRLSGLGGNEAGGFTGATAAKLRWPVDTDGIIINAGNTYGRTTQANDSSKTAAGTIIEGLHLLGRGNTGGTPAGTMGRGIQMRSRATVRDCVIFEWFENGVRIRADSGGTGDGLGNANNWVLERCQINGNAGHGLHTEGGDANAGVAYRCKFSVNDGWGVYENSQLGNAYAYCEFGPANLLGGAITPNTGSANTFIGCYEEGGQDFDLTNSIIIGGKAADRSNQIGNGFFIGGGPSGVGGTSFGLFNVVDDNNNAIWIGDGHITYIAANDDTTGLDFFHDDTDGVWEYEHSNAPVMGFTTDETTINFGRINDAAEGYVYFAKGFFAGDSKTNARLHTSATSIPTTGDFALGERRWRRTAVAGQNSEWICTVSGFTTTSWAAGNFYQGTTQRTNAGNTYQLEYRVENVVIPAGAATVPTGTGVITFDLPAHGATVGAWVHFQNTNSIGNVRLNSQQQITAVPDADTFVIESTDDATGNLTSTSAYTVDFGPNGVSANAPVHTTGSVIGADGHEWTWISAAASWSRASDSYIEASVTGVDPPSLAGGTVSGITTFTLTGVALGDFIDQVSFSLNLQGVRLDAWVSATNQGSYQFVNPTGNATVNLGSGTIRVRACKNS